jgi:hypothetical protein
MFRLMSLLKESGPIPRHYNNGTEAGNNYGQMRELTPFVANGLC